MRDTSREWRETKIKGGASREFEREEESERGIKRVGKGQRLRERK
jgi:hypothetical protein